MAGTGVAPGPPPEAESRGVGRLKAAADHRLLGRLWSLPLWCHSLCLIGLLVAAAPFLQLDQAFTIDEGAYAVQTKTLAEGDWEFSYQGEKVDAAGRWLPLYNPDKGEKGYFAYTKHPAYPAALRVATRLAGDVLGLRLLTLLGAVGVAAAAWLLAAELDPAASRASFWLAGLGPAAVNAHIMWAHAPAAALAGFATLAAVRLVRGWHALSAVLLIVLLAVGTLLRSESILFTAALAVSLVLVGFKGRAWPLRAGLPALCLGAAAVTLVVEQRWRSRILGSSASVQTVRGEAGSPVGSGAEPGALTDWAAGRIEGAWHSLFQGSFDQGAGTALLAAALILLGFGARSARRQHSGWERELELSLLGALALYGLRLIVGPDQPITGLLAAWPLALLGLALVGRISMSSGRLLLVTVAGFTLAVVATQYRIGGGREWGGRFFFPILAPLAVLACLGLRHAVARDPGAKAKVVGLLCGLAVLPSLTGLVVLGRSMASSGAVIDEVVAGRPGLVVTHVLGLPPFAWRTYPEVGWMVAPAGDLQEVVTRLRAGGFERVTLVAPAELPDEAVAAFPIARDVTGTEAGRRGWRILHLSAP